MDSDAFIVQFCGPPTDADRDDLLRQELVESIHFYLPHHAHIVRMDPDLVEAVQDLPFVRWVGPFHPAYKLEDELVTRLTLPVITQLSMATQTNNGGQRYSIMVLDRGEETLQRVAERVREVEGEVHEIFDQGFRLEATLTDDQLRQIAGMGEILFIEVHTDPEDEPVPSEDMDNVRIIGGANFLEMVEGYTGQGVRGEVMDSRLRRTHEAFQARPPIIHAGNDDDTPPGTPAGCGGSVRHGTCSYGVVFGDGTGDPTARGLLPDGQGIFAGRGFVTDRYAHTAELVDPNDDFRAVFQTNSWGGGLTTQYNTTSAEFDDILFLNDILVTQSQSHDGTQMSRPQAWAKNVVAVGGVFHMDSLNRDNHNWGGGASFGPASDGRVKPDLVHFYDAVRTTQTAADNAYGNYSGTSAATPITAGHFGLLFQMWADGVFEGGPGMDQDVFDSRPRAATARALMINTAFQYDFVGGSMANQDITRARQGWGMADVGRLYELARQHSWDLPLLVNEDKLLLPGGDHQETIHVGASDCFLKATMVYKDPMGNPASTEHRVNDLTLRLISPGGTEFWGNNGLITGLWSAPGGSSDTINTVENVSIQTAEEGAWSIEVHGDEIVQNNFLFLPFPAMAVYSLVVTKCAELDAEVVSLEVVGPAEVVDPPHEILAGEDVDITLEAVVINNGDGGPSPATFNVTFDAVAPDNCLIVGPDQKVEEGVALNPGEDKALQVVFTIHCTEASFHTFQFSAEIAPDLEIDPDVRDTDHTNNSASIDMEVGVIKQVDVGVIAIGFDINQMRAVVNPVEPWEPMVGIGPLAAPWAGAGDRPLPWDLTGNSVPDVLQCGDPDGHMPQPGHGNWANPRDPITLVVHPGAPVSIFIDDLNCSDDDVPIEKKVTLTVLEGDCTLNGGAVVSETVLDDELAGWTLQSAPVVFTDALTLGDTLCRLRVDVAKEPSEIHFELLGDPEGSIEVVLLPAKEGRMTGGGSVFDADDVRYTHGLQLRCDGSRPHNLQVNWDQGNRFHLETITGIICFEDPAVSEGRPAAGFNTMLGHGLGRLNGSEGTPVWFHFTDTGEPGGGGDLAEFIIGGLPKVSGTLDSGNHQAHRDRP